MNAEAKVDSSLPGGALTVEQEVELEEEDESRSAMAAEFSASRCLEVNEDSDESDALDEIMDEFAAEISAPPSKTRGL